jgi:hypothetical protein
MNQILNFDRFQLISIILLWFLFFAYSQIRKMFSSENFVVLLFTLRSAIHLKMSSSLLLLPSMKVRLCHTLLGWQKIKIQNFKYGFY